MTAPPESLALENISRHFGSVRALDGASLSVRNGTVHAVLGENGAGKTTLMRVAFGLVRPDAGMIRVRGRAVTIPTPAAAIALGIGMVHQHFSSVPALTVVENVALGGHGVYRAAHVRARVREVCELVGFELDPDARAGDLSVGAQQRLEIVKALARGATTLILDEPTAVLAPREADDLLGLLRRFAASGGTAILITHKLPEALAVANDVTVLRHGRTVLAQPVPATDSNLLAEAMIGGAPPVDTRHERCTPGAIVVATHALGVRDARGVLRARDINLEVRAREILGIAGVDGAGQHELLLCMAGRLAPGTGSIERPADVGFVPEDRHRDALVLDFDVAENLALCGAGDARGRIPWATLRTRAAALLTEYDVRAPSSETPVGTLSGGNQQKLVLARELESRPPLVIVENGTRGLDIAATEAIHERLRNARDRGAAVVVYSSDLDEVLGLADRLIVMFDGRAREVTMDRVAAGRAMLGAA
ncbi:MAG TPA: ABC transporter ATP-binding protein [Gemmatimonadaceae bacterium]|nr:ABC transporter ATP-binding protein [Gemmatimonadaceae bacterium]